VSARELREHLAYWSDDVKIAAFRGALARVVTPQSVVLDLGCGTGLLGLLACEAGAARVYAVDAGPILSVARELAAANGFSERIVHISGWSTEIGLPELVDVVGRLGLRRWGVRLL
jgi:ribosomal protein L11 methylase PrmA